MVDGLGPILGVEERAVGGPKLGFRDVTDGLGGPIFRA